VCAYYNILSSDSNSIAYFIVITGEKCSLLKITVMLQGIGHNIRRHVHVSFCSPGGGTGGELCHLPLHTTWTHGSRCAVILVSLGAVNR